jgi:hypothetical protein
VTVVYLAIVAHGSYDVLGDGGRQAHAFLAEGAFEAEDSVDGVLPVGVVGTVSEVTP